MKPHEHGTDSPPLWRNRNYLLLQGGQIVSYIGNQQQFIALPLLVLALTGSVFQAGIAVSLSTIAVLVVSPIAGALVDRWDRKRTMVICDAGRMLIILTIPLAFWLHILTMVQVDLVVTIAGVLGTIFSVANSAALPNVVPRDQLPVALSQSQAAYSVVRTFGSLLGGTLYTLEASSHSSRTPSPLAHRCFRWGSSGGIFRASRKARGSRCTGRSRRAFRGCGNSHSSDFSPS